jgi:ATPase family associated with various cellular activities (AAA)
MLDEGINNTILEHFTVRLPDPAGVRLERLFYPDYGFKEAGRKDADGVNRIKRDSVALTMQKMRAHVLRTGGDMLHSLVLHGPGGTGKTTLIEALANTCNVPLIEVTPSDIVKSGEADIEKRARAVFESLSMLSQVVILFDEFDPVLRRRDPSAKGGTTIYSFLTPGMLPKLKALSESARGRRVAYALMTNLIGSLDVPAVRKGRFDEAIGIFPSDPLSRAGYMAKICNNYATKNVSPWDGRQYNRERFVEVVRRTKGIGMTPLTAKGWFRLNDDTDLTKKPIGYILGWHNTSPEIDDPEEVWKQQLGSGPFAERESRQWQWLTDWENNCPPKDKWDNETSWKTWLDYVNTPPAGGDKVWLIDDCLGRR